MFETLNRWASAAGDAIDRGIQAGRESLTTGAMQAVQEDPSRLDGMIQHMSPQAQQFYDRLGPTGQENLKGIIAQDPRFLPALSRAMEGGQQPAAEGQTPGAETPGAQTPQSMLTSLPPGMTNLVLTEMNNDAQFRNRMIEALERDPSTVAEVVGNEAGQDTQFGMAMGREGFRAVLNGEMNMNSLGGMGGMMQGMMGGLFNGMLGSLFQNLGGLFEGLQGILGQIFQSISGMLGGDRMVQSVGDAPNGQRPIDFATRMAQKAGIVPGGEIYEARAGEVTPRSTTADVTVGADTPMDPSRRNLADPNATMTMGPR